MKPFRLLCPGEELNFLTTIFSRTLYHLSYRDLYIIYLDTFKSLLGRRDAPPGEVRPLRGLASSGGPFLFRYSRNRTHICFISSKMLYQSAIYLKNTSLWVRFTCDNLKMGRPRSNRVCVRSTQPR